MVNEKIYTIKISEALAEKCTCPLCSIEQKTEKDEIERILGAAMMEPNVRIETNKQGFCERHYQALLNESNKLSLALMLQSHLTELSEKLFAGSLFSKDPDPKKQIAVLNENKKQCYLCSRVNTFMSQTLSAFLYMYKTNEDMDAKIKEQPYICLKHTRMLFEMGQKSLPKDLYKKFCKTVNEKNLEYAKTLLEDIDWFCKKFDYRYKDEDWKNSKDAAERTIKFLNER